MSSMKNRFEKISKNNVPLSIVMIVLGLVLFIWPGKTLTLAARILGIALLLGGLGTGLSWYRNRGKAGTGYESLAVAIVCVIAGVVVLVAPEGVVSLLPKLVGIAVAVNGIINLAQAMELSKSAVGGKSSLILALLTIALGIFLVVFSFKAMEVAVMVIGGICVYNGVSNLWIESRYRKM